MKLIIVLLTTAILHVSASSFAQKITLNEKNAQLSNVFKEIRKQSNYDFLYDKATLKNAKPVNVNLKDATIEETLKACLDGQQLTYTIEDKIVIIKEKTSTILDKIKAAFAAIDVHGRVTGDDNQPLSGATVIVKGGSNSTSTDENGYFTLKSVDPNTTLVISFIGFEKLEIKAKSELGNIKLVISQSKLDEVKVIAYGQTTERLSIGDISSVSAKEIAEQPVGDPLLTLEGRVPGLFITQNTGFSGSAVNVQILGQNSISNGNAPLYVIDGVPYPAQLLPGFGSAQGISPSPFAFLNPADISSISVLKDADATSIYGSRAANGAILITTKKGVAGDTRVDLNIQNGWGKMTRRINLLNTQQYLQLRNEALKNDGIAAPGITDYDINGTYDQNAYTDWQKALIGGTAHYTDIQGSVSGGNANTQFLVGVGDHRETTVIPGDNADQKTSLHFSLTNASNNKRFKLQLTASYLFDNNNIPTADPTTSAMELPPNAPALYNADGSVNWALDKNGNSTWPATAGGNPLAYTLKKISLKTNNLVSDATLSYSLAPGFELKSNFGYNYMQQNGTEQVPLTSYAPAARSFSQRGGIFINNNINSWIIEPQLTYNRAFGASKLQAIIGGTINQQNTYGTLLVGTGFSSDLLIADPGAAGTINPPAVAASVYKYNALFGRVNYNWQDKYLLDVSIRRDGSSRFGPANRFHDFWSAGAGWIFSEEGFVKNHFPALSFGKLKASCGTTGNDQIGDYQYQSNYSTTGYPNPYQGTVGLLPFSLPNPYLQWEQTNKASAGLDLGLFKNRILLTSSYFRTRSSNQLVGYTLPFTTGFTRITENLPATVQNSGWEFSLNTVNLKTVSFSWKTSFSLTIPKNELVDFPNLATSSLASSRVIGQPVSILKAYDLVGVDPQTGTYQFRKANGQISSVPVSATDQTVLINTDPKLYGGLNNSFAYKGFQLDIFLQFTKKLASNYFANAGSFLPGQLLNQPVSVLQSWQMPGDVATVQKASSNNSLATPYFDVRSSVAGYSDASYIRLKTVSLSWSAPGDWAKKIHAQNIRIYAQGQNLLTFTHFKGLDPEIAGSYTLPPLAMMTLGIQAGF